MARIVRPMLVDEDGSPRVGNRSKCLGVREPPAPSADVNVDASGVVLLDGSGLSVTKDWRLLQGHLIPQQLENEFNGASCKGMRVFVHGAGDCLEGGVSETLLLVYKPNSDTAGNVTPAAPVLLSQFQADLEATRGGSVIDEH